MGDVLSKLFVGDSWSNDLRVIVGVMGFAVVGVMTCAMVGELTCLMVRVITCSASGSYD